MCHQIYIKKKILEPYASYKCRSKTYPSTMFIYATPRNNIAECFDGSDEPDENNSESYNILFTSSFCVLILYVVLRYSANPLKAWLKRNNQQNDQCIEDMKGQKTRTDDFTKFIFCLDRYKKDHNSQDAIDLTTLYLLSVINTMSNEEQEIACRMFYELEEEIHNNVESEIHLCLHRKLDPKVTQSIMDAKFPGLTARCIKFFEDLARRRFINWIQNRITKSQKIKETIGCIVGIIKIESKYIDLFKDTALSLIMLEALGGTLMGGTEAIYNLPTAFSSIIVTLLIGSIVIPVFLSTLHLIVNIKLLINDGNVTKLRKYLLIVICWFCSFFNPVILFAYYHELKEDVRKMTQKENTDAIGKLRTSRNFKKEVIQFHKIELGT